MRRHALVMRRHAVRLLLALSLGTLPILLALVLVLTRSASGRALLARSVAAELHQLLRGDFEVGSISGSFLRGVRLERVTVRDSSGALLASLPRAEVSYRLRNLLVGRVVLTRVRLEHPVIHITKHPAGRLNFQEVLRLGEGPPGGGHPFIEFRNVEILGGTLRLSMPWSPPDTARSEAARQSALAADRARPGRVIESTPEGLQRVITMTPLTVRFRRILISSPDDQPLTFDIDTLATSISDPAVIITSAKLRGWTRDDSLTLSVARATLPHTTVYGGGVITWPRGPIHYDCALVAPRLDLTDLRWVSSDFPALAGRAIVGLQTESDSLDTFVLRNLDLAGPTGRVEGRVTALTTRRLGLGVRDMELQLTDLDLDVVRPYLDTLPFYGTLTGSLAGAGFFDRMDVNLDLWFRDARLPEHPLSRFALAGPVVLNGPHGFEFRQDQLRQTDVELRSIRSVIPAVVLEGRVRGVGTLDGPFHDVTFEGRLEHEDGARPTSLMTGTVTLDSRRETLGLVADVDFAPLDFEGIRRGFPSLPSRGTLRGHVAASGYLDRLAIHLDVRGALGAVRGEGYATLLPPRWATDSLALEFENLDLAQVRGTGPETSLTGHLLVSGAAEVPGAPTGRLALQLSRGSIREFGFDTAAAAVSLADSLIRLDSLRVAWLAGGLRGAGALGWGRTRDSVMQFQVRADSLRVLDSLLLDLSGHARDTTAGSVPLEGSAGATVRLAGSLDSIDLALQGAVQDVAWQHLRSSNIDLDLRWTGGPHPWLDASLASDSLSLKKWVARSVEATVVGWADSLDWRGSAGLGNIALLRSGGSWHSEPLPEFRVDSLVVDLPARLWRLQDAVAIALTDSVFQLTPLRLEPEDGSGSIRVAGRFPRAGRGDLAVQVLGLELQDVYSLLQFDTAGVAGRVALDLTVAGSADAPQIQGTGSLADARFEDFNAPFVQGVVNYADRSLEANLLVWRTGEPVLRIESRLPLDLALRGVERRRVAGPLYVRATADSTNLGVIEAFTPTVRGVRGILNADAEVAGSWEDPRLSGFLAVTGASVGLPGLGVRYSGITGRVRLAADSIKIESLRLEGGQGTLQIAGGMRLEDLARPVLDLRFRADRFLAVDVRSLISLEATGDLSLSGPVLGARLSGHATANRGALHFADLVTKRIVDLESTADSELIDRTIVKRQNLGAAFQNRFLDSLIIEDLGLDMGESFWLRSGEANIQLDGSMTINKARGTYRLYGTLNALRGTYALKVGFVTRNFVVERGTVRYFGTPDLNADLDIEARHTLRTVPDNEEIPVIANITGTLLAPKLTLTSDQHPPLSETELVSYLMFGQPSFGLASGNSAQGANELGAVNTAVSYLSSALSNELQRTLTTDLGVPIDYIEVRPGQWTTGSTSPTGVSSVAQVAAGWQIGRQWFVTVNADVCTNRTQLYPKAEFRVSSEVRLKASVEPSLYCTDINPSFQATVNRYQVGFDVLWQREW